MSNRCVRMVFLKECFVSQGSGDDFKEIVRSNTNIVDLASETVALKPLRGGSSTKQRYLLTETPAHFRSLFVGTERVGQILPFT